MAYFCWTCGAEQVFEVKVGVKVGRRDGCPQCAADLHVCKNCGLYDPNIHNMCREPEASFIRDREAANFCAHFDFAERDAAPRQANLDQAKAKLEDLFKNLRK